MVSKKSLNEDFTILADPGELQSVLEHPEPAFEVLPEMSIASENGKGVQKYLIVGSGVCGLFVAWQLIKQNLDKVEMGKPFFKIVEQSDRIGGRLWTDTFKDGGYHNNSNTRIMRCEEGGMRFCYDRKIMPKLYDLIQDLDKADTPSGKLADDIVPFPMKPTGIDSRRLWFNGQGVTQWYAEHNPQIWAQLFYLEPEEQLKAPMAIFREVYQRLLKENYGLLVKYFGSELAEEILEQDYQDSTIAQTESVEFWYAFRKYFTHKDRYLYTYSIKALLVNMGYSSGCIDMLANASGFKCFIETEGNAGVVLQMCLMHEAMASHFSHFNQGFYSLIKKLIEVITKFVGEASTWCDLDTTAVRLRRDDSGDGAVYELQCKLRNQSSKGKGCDMLYRARRVVLAIPPLAIKELFYEPKTPSISDGPRNLSPSPQGHVAINSVYGVRMTKIILYFNQVWWNDTISGRLYGCNTTNLPLAQIYTFYTEDSTPDNSIPTGLDDISGAVVVYCDDGNARFWKSLQALPPYFTSELQEQYKALQAVTVQVVDQALIQLSKLFNKTDIPYPVLTTYSNWDGENMRSVAIHQWIVNADDREMRKLIVKPISHPMGKTEENIYVCNEAWSPFQGWVEGSLIAAQDAVDKILEDERAIKTKV